MAGILRKPTFVLLSAVLILAGLSLAEAGTVRGHRVPTRSSGGHHARPYYGHGYGYGYYGGGISYYYLPYYAGFGYYWGAPYPYYPAYAAPRYVRDVAYIDTDVSPGKARVYLDGQLMGTADDFDGFPQYLAVEPGRHVIRFEADGRMSISRTVRVPRGTVVGLDFKLPKGSGEAPSSEGNEEIVIPEPESPDAGAESDATMAPPRGDIEEGPEAGNPGFVRLKITPPDASVYIDGKFVGSAATLSRLHGDMRLESGAHQVEVVRPGYKAARREIKLFAGDRITVDISLEAEAGGR